MNKMTYFDDLIIHFDRFHDIIDEKDDFLQMHTFVVAKSCYQHN